MLSEHDKNPYIWASPKQQNQSSGGRAQASITILNLSEPGLKANE